MEEKDVIKKKEKGLSSLASILGSLYNRSNLTNESVTDEDKALAECVKVAYEEWQNAENFFHSVSDPDLIDHAIYKLEATKARYIYLLKQAKANGIRMNIH